MRPRNESVESMSKASASTIERSHFNIPERVLIVGLGASGASSVRFLAVWEKR